jgi:serine protease Do
MKTFKRITLIAVFFMTVGLVAGLVISSSLNLFTNGYTQDIKISRESIDILGKMNQAMSEVAAAVKPAVVNISSTKTVHTRGMPSPFFDDPFFREFFGNPFQGQERSRDYKQSGLGSGVLVAKDGYILTNNHVIKDADEIKVRLSDKRVFKGKIVGADPKTDLAVIKIDADNLPSLKLGDSDQLKVGDMVIAVGNPFGLNQTVTTGIISAKGRADVGLADYEDFIQTDAAINPGNSGGALVNIKGELIGINTAILSSTGGYQGIGFAIPANMAKVVMDSLIKKGKVVRGWLGVSIQPITPELAKQLGLKNEKGALVADITEDSPAAGAGMQRGDVITEFDGKEVADASTLKNIVAAIPPGKEVVIKYFRDGVEKTAKVPIRELSAQAQKMAGQADNQFKGVSVQKLTSDMKRNMGISQRVSGVIVADVAGDSPAAEVLQQGDVIMEINKKKINDVTDYKAAVAKVKPGEKALVLVYRSGAVVYVLI